VDAKFFLGNSYFSLNDKENAVKAYAQCLEGPNNSYTEYAASRGAQIYYNSERYAEAIPFYERVEGISSKPATVFSARLGLMRSYFIIKSWSKAYEKATLVLENTGINNTIRQEGEYVAGIASYEVKNYSLALPHLEWLVKNTTTATAAEAKFIIAEMYYAQQDYVNSDKTIRELLKMKPSYNYWTAKALILQSRVQLATDDLFQAERTLNSVINHYKTTDDGILSEANELMQEIQQLHAALKPIETLFVVDAMQGQDAVNVAQAFGAALPLTGVILTKLDGDSRGGAALSVRHVTGQPIKFVGTGEKINGLEPFHPDRLASRILGMGDVLSLIEEVQKSVDHEQAEKLARKVKSGQGFDLEDFKQQVVQMRKMGGMSALMDKLPSELARAAQNAPQVDDKSIARLEGIINSMTALERAKPELLKASRKRRIATGAGVSVQEVNRLLSQFEQTQKMMKMVAKGGMAKMMRNMKGMFPGMR
jgi:tetratricopeptide (TPR) repeat protein